MTTSAPYVEVYWNLHKECFSFRRPGGRVSHAKSLLLANVKFVVQPAGREKVLREKKKNVHAFVRGDLVYVEYLDGEKTVYRSNEEANSVVIDTCLETGQGIRYNPYEAGYFQRTSYPGAVKSAVLAYLQNKNIFALGASYRG